MSWRSDATKRWFFCKGKFGGFYRPTRREDGHVIKIPEIAEWRQYVRPSEPLKAPFRRPDQGQ